MPTLLQVYSFHQTNKLVTTTIEYAVKQFYLLNRKPFIMQMFGAVSAILDTDEEGVYGDASKVQSSCLFNLLLSLETPSPDPLNIGKFFDIVTFFLILRQNSYLFLFSLKYSFAL